MKRLIPYNLKVRLHLLINFCNYFLNGNLFLYAKKRKTELFYKFNFQIKQDIKKTNSSKAKIHNFDIAIKQIEQIEILPNEIFSFWRIVGNPSKKKGFVASRSITNGKITPTIGGGLCQLSGLIYYACLQADLQIVERYNHSADIYTEENRFTPLGSDATVVYGYKDLQFKNNLSTAIKFTFQLTESKLLIQLDSVFEITKKTITFTKKQIKNKIEVTTYSNNKKIAISLYD